MNEKIIHNTVSPNLFLLKNRQKDLSGGLSGDSFAKMIELCFSRATKFSLRQSNLLPTYPSFIEEKLSPYVVGVYSVKQWFAWTGGEQEYREIVYQAVPGTREIILSYFDDIFLINRKKIPKKKQEQIGKTFLYPSFLEDLCFFQKNSMFLGTLSHEYICAAKPPDDLFEKSLCALASWEKCTQDGWGMERVYFK